jgi:hypothetical protein
MRIKTVGVAAVGLAALAVTAGYGGQAGAAPGPAAQRDGGCAVSALPELPGTVSGRATAADPTGRYVGGDLTTADGSVHAVLWTRGVLAELSVGLNLPQVTDINAAGTVVGYGYRSTSNGGSQAWSYRHGR